MRLGILHDSAAQERMYAREVADAAAKKKAAETPTVRTEAQQKIADAEAAESKTKGSDKDKDKEKPKPPNIRPLSEARAIELGANFIAEGFIFAVAAGLLVFERWWSRRKENKKDEHVVERLQALEDQTEAISHLEAEIQRLRTIAEAAEILRLEQTAANGKGAETADASTKQYTTPKGAPGVQGTKDSAKIVQDQKQGNRDGSSGIR